MDYSLGQLRGALSLAGLSKDDIKKISGRESLVSKIKEMKAESFLSATEVELNDTESIFSGAVEEENDVVASVDCSSVPQYASDAWQEYVLSQLKPDEYETKGERKFPKAGGLRRVIQQLIGPIVESGPTVMPFYNDTAVVVYQLKIGWFVGLSAWVKENLEAEDLQYRTFSEVADASPDNTPSPFNKYLVATASTRAEGRALKKALALNITTAEEVGISSEDAEETISVIQLNSLNIMTDRLGINKERFIKYELGVVPTELSKISKENGRKLLEKLNELQGNPDVIPEAIK